MERPQGPISDPVGYNTSADFAGKAKWDAWKKNEGMSQEEAKQKYIDTLLEMFSKSGECEHVC